MTAQELRQRADPVLLQHGDPELPKIEEYDQNKDAANEAGDIVPDILNVDTALARISFEREKYRRSQKQFTKTSLLKSTDKNNGLGQLESRQSSLNDFAFAGKVRPTSRSVYTNIEKRRNTQPNEKSEKVTTSFTSSMQSSQQKRLNSYEQQFLTSLQFQAKHFQE